MSYYCEDCKHIPRMQAAVERSYHRGYGDGIRDAAPEDSQSYALGYWAGKAAYAKKPDWWEIPAKYPRPNVPVLLKVSFPSCNGVQKTAYAIGEFTGRVYRRGVSFEHRGQPQIIVGNKPLDLDHCKLEGWMYLPPL